MFMLLFVFRRGSIGLIIDIEDKILFLWDKFDIFCLTIFVWLLIIFTVGFDGFPTLVESMIVRIND